MPINTPPGCFGHGPGPLKTSAGKLHFNTSSFISYAQAYEFALIVSSTKDGRRAMVTLEVDVGSIPAPIVQAACLNEERDCFPMAGGVMVNPTSRLALVGSCVDECVGDLSYLWTVLPSAPDHRLDYVSCVMNRASRFCPLSMRNSISDGVSKRSRDDHGSTPFYYCRHDHDNDRGASY